MSFISVIIGGIKDSENWQGAQESPRAFVVDPRTLGPQSFNDLPKDMSLLCGRSRAGSQAS